MSDNHLKQLAYDKVLKHFGGDHQKTWEWFQSSHPDFAMITPMQMIQRGQVKRLLRLIETRLGKTLFI